MKNSIQTPNGKQAGRPDGATQNRRAAEWARAIFDHTGLSSRAVAMAMLLWMASLAHADYSIDRYAIAGGAGTSTNGAFAISGTIGQHGASVMSNAMFKVEGGFWSGITLVQTPGAPLLKIHLAGANAVISWPLAAAGFQLEETTQLGAARWMSTPQPIIDTAGERTVTVPAAGAAKLYRLRKP